MVSFVVGLIPANVFVYDSDGNLNGDFEFFRCCNSNTCTAAQEVSVVSDAAEREGGVKGREGGERGRERERGYIKISVCIYLISYSCT